MLFESWYLQILGLLPEALGFVALSTALVKERISLKKLCTTGLIICLLFFLMFQLPITYGVHITIGVILLILVFRLVLKLSFTKSAVASILSFIILISIESIYLLIFMHGIGFPKSMFTDSEEHIRFLLALPSIITILIAGIVAQYRLHRKHVALTENVGEICQ
jgi:hypothetical protein